MGLIISALMRTQFNQYINQETLLLGILLSFQTMAALFVEKKKRDPFVTILCFTMIIYFSLRIFTLTIYPVSTVFTRYPFNADNLNYALKYIILANIFMYVGFFSIKRKIKLVEAENFKATSFVTFLYILMLSLVFVNAKKYFWTEDNIPAVLNPFIVFINEDLLILLGFIYVVIFRKSINIILIIVFCCLVIVDGVLNTLMGSRGAIVLVIQNIMIAVLAVENKIRLKKYFIIPTLFFVPILIVLAIASFAMSLQVRGHRAQDSYQFQKNYDILKNGIEEYALRPVEKSGALLLPKIFDRVGYLDFSSEIIANSKHYSDVINMTSYGKSIIDNIFTPGFDVYDQPKISNSLRFVYNPVTTYTTLDYAIWVYEKDYFCVYERGVKKAEFLGYGVGDRFSIERSGTIISYKRNGISFYTSTTPSSGTLSTDVFIYHGGATVSHVDIFNIEPHDNFNRPLVEINNGEKLSDLKLDIDMWTGLNGVSVNGNTIEKVVNTDGWDHGFAMSSTLISGDGGVQFSPNENNSDRIIGLISPTNRNKPSKKYVAKHYHSDQIGVYGELFTLLGYGPSLIVFFLLAFLFKLFYVKLDDLNPFHLGLKRLLFLYIFNMTLNSFGFDWIIFQSVILVIFMLIYKIIFQCKSDTEESASNNI